MSELKRCPFCGGEADVIRYSNPFNTFFQVVCTNCHISQTGSEFWHESESIAAWNTRKPVERVLERLEKKNRSLHNANWNAAIEEAIEIIKEEFGCES